MTSVADCAGGSKLDRRAAKPVETGLYPVLQPQGLVNPERATCSGAEIGQRSYVGESGLPDFAKELTWRSEVHFDACPVFGKSRLRDGLVVPGWARERAGRVVDVLAGSIPVPSACLCHEWVLRHSTQRGEIVLSPVAVSRGIKASEAYFVHTVLSAADAVTGACPVHWERGVERTPSVFSKLGKRQHPRSCTRMKRRHVGVQVALGKPGINPTCSKFSKIRISELPAGGPPPYPGGSLSNLTIDNSHATSGGMKGRKRVRSKGKAIATGSKPTAPRLAHFGDHSIVGNGCAEMNRSLASSSSQQNILSWLANRISTSLGDNIVEDVVNGSMGVVTHLIPNAPYTQANEWVAQGDFTLWHVDVANVNLSVIGGHRLGRTDDTLLAGFLSDKTNYNTRALAASLAAAIRVDLTVAQIMANYVTLSPDIMDNTAMYAKGWLLMFLREIIDRHPGDPLGHVWLDGNDFYVRSFADADLGMNFEADVTARRFVYLAADLQDSMINCLRHLSRSQRVFNAIPDRANPVAARILWFAVPTAVYYRVAQGALPAIADFTAEEMRATLVHIARSRGEMQQLALGFVKALALVCTREHARPAAPAVNYWFTCTLEPFSHFRWQAPSDSNPIYRWLNAMKSDEVEMVPRDEIRVLEQGTAATLLQYAIAAGALLSLGVSLALNSQNLNGNFLNGVANSGLLPMAQVQTFGQSLFRPQPTSGIPAIFAIACAEITHVSSIVFQPMAFRQGGWACAMTQMAGVTNHNWWGGIWDFRVPYLIEPFAASWMLERWPYVFGIFESNVALEVRSDCILSGGMAGWYASKGCGAYKAIAVGGGKTQPWVYENYGLAVINAICQEARRLVPPAIQVQRWARGHEAGVVGPPNAPGDLINAVVDYNAALHTLKPGVLRSYDWATDNCLSPLVVRLSWAAAEWARIHTGSYSNLIGTGILRMGATVQMGNSIGEFDALSLYGGGSDSAPSAGGGTQDESEN